MKRSSRKWESKLLRYTDEIDFDQDLSLYDVMINHFVNGDLDDVFDTSVTKGMSDTERKDLFDLTREFVGLCFSNGDVDYWLDSLENTPIFDYSLIAYSIFNSFDFLLDIITKKVSFEELGDWYNIRLADGNEGWIAKKDIEII